MGVVYLARDPVIGRDVAVKLLRFSDDADARERFTREVRIAGQLAHPNIVRIYDAGEFGGQPFIAMEYVEGDTLDRTIKKGEPLELQTKLDLMIDLADAMSAAHARGIVHRDIKPSNLIIDAHQHLKVLDFGIARISDSLQNTSFSVIGTPNYMAPEQIRGEPVDARCDIFAAGVVLYELISYRRPFVADNVQALQYRILFEAPPPLSSVAPGIPDALEHLVHRCLDKQTNRRPQTAKDLQQLLRESRHALTSEQTSMTARPLDGPTQLAPDSSKRGGTPGGGRASTPGRSHVSSKRVAELRAKQLAELLDQSRYALTDGRPDDALEAAERAMVLDENDAAALELADLARKAIERREAAAALQDARRWLDESSIEPARLALGRVRELWATSAELPALEERLDQLQREAAAIGTTLPEPGAAPPPAQHVLVPPPVRPGPRPDANAPAAKQPPTPAPAAGPAKPPLKASPVVTHPAAPAAGAAPAAAAPKAGAAKAATPTPPAPVRAAKGRAPAAAVVEAEVDLPLKGPEAQGTLDSGLVARHDEGPASADAVVGERRFPVAIVALLVLMVLGGAGGAFYYYSSRPASSPAPAAEPAASTTPPAVPNAGGDAQTTPATPATQGASEPTAAPEPPAPPATPGLISVSIDALPWARVAVSALGSTPRPKIGTLTTPVRVDLAPGEYELLLENGGLTSQVTRRIRVAPGENASFRYQMPGFAAAAVVDELMGGSK